MSDKQVVQITLLPGVEEKVRQLAHAMTLENIDEEQPSPVGQLIELLLPDLLDNAMAGDFGTQIETQGVDTAKEEPVADISAAVASATAELENPDISVTLETNIQPQPEQTQVEDEPAVTMEQLEQGGVNLKALAWAKGNPSKEKALRETCSNLPVNAWGWDKVLQLAERTYEMKQGDSDA